MVGFNVPQYRESEKENLIIFPSANVVESHQLLIYIPILDNRHVLNQESNFPNIVFQ